MPYFDGLDDTLLVDSTDLQGLDGIAFLDISGLLMLAQRKGDHEDKQGDDGVNGAPLPYAPGPFTIPILVFGDTRAEMFANLWALSDVLAGADQLGLVGLERRLTIATGPGYVAHTAPGAFSGFANTAVLFNSNTLQTDLNFINLAGQWSPDGGTTWLTP